MRGSNHPPRQKNTTQALDPLLSLFASDSRLRHTPNPTMSDNGGAVFGERSSEIQATAEEAIVRAPTAPSLSVALSLESHQCRLTPRSASPSPDSLLPLTPRPPGCSPRPCSPPRWPGQAYVNSVPPRAGETMMNVPYEQHDVVRVASIGIGGRGGGQLNEMLAVEGAVIVAISDQR